MVAKWKNSNNNKKKALPQQYNEASLMYVKPASPFLLSTYGGFLFGKSFFFNFFFSISLSSPYATRNTV